MDWSPQPGNQPPGWGQNPGRQPHPGPGWDQAPPPQPPHFPGQAPQAQPPAGPFPGQQPMGPPPGQPPTGPPQGQYPPGGWQQQPPPGYQQPRPRLPIAPPPTAPTLLALLGLVGVAWVQSLVMESSDLWRGKVLTNNLLANALSLVLVALITIAVARLGSAQRPSAVLLFIAGAVAAIWPWLPLDPVERFTFLALVPGSLGGVLLITAGALAMSRARPAAATTGPTATLALAVVGLSLLALEVPLRLLYLGVFDGDVAVSNPVTLTTALSAVASTGLVLAGLLRAGGPTVSARILLIVGGALGALLHLIPQLNPNSLSIIQAVVPITGGLLVVLAGLLPTTRGSAPAAPAPQWQPQAHQ
ncbi:hypothetical protein JOF53_005074 [Crossiella equi]|uniref:Uncharacterized protein n=1 Tax=Crossiella equi TaxID=130796 RepID=A0ABS5AIJ2_9PSEU|nr:hypothetical protein [Crossiella equi]MBP2476202.1 hypothetical protein [Crossiella equi]